MKSGMIHNYAIANCKHDDDHDHEVLDRIQQELLEEESLPSRGDQVKLVTSPADFFQNLFGYVLNVIV